MPPLTDEQTRGNVVKEWILGFSRDTMAAQNNIGAGTVTSIISNYKAGLESLDFDSIRQLAVEARQHGWNLSKFASHTRLYNYFIKSGASEDRIESFITKISSGDVSPEKVIQLVYQLHEISQKESILLDQVQEYIKQKLEEKQNIDEEIKQAYAVLQSKNVSIEAINEHIQLKEELRKYGLSTNDTHKLLNLLAAANEYRYSPGKIVAKLRNIKWLENKENKLKNSCEMLSKQADKYKMIIPLAQIIWDMHIGKSELISFKIAVNKIAETYGLPHSSAAFHVLNTLKDYNEKGHLKKELSALYVQKHILDEACSRQSESLIALSKLKSYGITGDRLLQLNNVLLKNDVYEDKKLNAT